MEANRAGRIWVGITVLLLILIAIVWVTGVEDHSPEGPVAPEPIVQPEPIVEPGQEPAPPVEDPYAPPVPDTEDDAARIGDPMQWGPGLSAHDVARFQRKGLEDPVGDILRDLTGRVDLIPDEGVLGGTMYIVTRDSYILTDRWVLATYEDGHIRGRMLAEYRVQDDGRITWRRIDAYLE